jgi:hypothetical protein
MRDVVVRIALLALVNAGLPTLAFILLPSRVGGVVPALVIGTAIPALFVLIQWPIHKKLDPIGALAALAYGIGLLVFVASGENPFVLKIQEAALTTITLAGIAVATRLVQRRLAEAGALPGKALKGESERFHTHREPRTAPAPP